MKGGIVRVCGFAVAMVVASAAAPAQDPPKGPPAEVIAEAFTAISRRDPYPVVTLLARPDITPNLRAAGLKLLADLGPSGTAALLRVSDSEPRLLRLVAEIHLKPPETSRDLLFASLWEVPGFDEAMRADDLRHGGRTVDDGGRIADLAPRATPFGAAHFTPFLKDSRPDVRAAAAAGLARHDHPGAFRVLASMLAESDPASGAAALEAIADCLPKGALEAALPFLVDEDEGRLSGAVAVVAALGAPMATDAGIAALAVVREPATTRVLDALARSTERGALVVLLVDALSLGRVRDPLTVAQRVVSVGADIQPRFAEGLIDHGDSAVRAFALAELARRPTGKYRAEPERLALFDAASRDEAALVRIAACRGLGSVKDPLARVALVARLSDPFASVREAAVEGLGGQAAIDSTAVLRRTAGEDRDPSVRNAARLVLLSFGVADGLDVLLVEAGDDVLGPRTRRALRAVTGRDDVPSEAELREALRTRARGRRE